MNHSAPAVVSIRMKRRVAPVGIVAAFVLAAGMLPAFAGGSPLHLDRRAYRVRDEVVAAAEVSTGELGWVEDGPFYAYLRSSRSRTGLVATDPGDVLLGEIELSDITAHNLWATVRFEVPQVPSGWYYIAYCNDPCTAGLGDLIGSWEFWVRPDWGSRRRAPARWGPRAT